MPYANNNGVRIYYEVEGKGPPLVFFQALGLVLQLWRDSGYVEALKNDYQLILMEPRGHGGSDKPHDAAAYRLEAMVSDVTAVMDDLGIDKAHFWGYSLGGWIGLYIPVCALGRFHSLIIGGFPLDSLTPEAAKWFREFFDKGVDNYVAAIEKRLKPCWTPQLREKLLGSDMEALKANVDALTDVYDLRASLSSLSLPCLVYVGEDDDPEYCAAAKEAAERIPNATLVSLPGLGHFSAIYRSDLVIPHVRKFLSEVSQAASPTEGESNVSIR